MFWRFGKIKLGRDKDEPEFSHFACFAMLFIFSIATRLFYYAVSEPQDYYTVGDHKMDGYYERSRWSYSGSSGTASTMWRSARFFSSESLFFRVWKPFVYFRELWTLLVLPAAPALRHRPRGLLAAAGHHTR